MYILIGIVAGIATGIGFGGGSLLILFLTYLMHMEQHMAQSMNLIYFIPTSISALIVYLRNKNVETKLGKKLIFPIVIGAAVGAYFANLIDAKNLKKYFGIFLGLVGMLDIVMIVKQKKKGE